MKKLTHIALLLSIVLFPSCDTIFGEVRIKCYNDMDMGIAIVYCYKQYNESYSIDSLLLGSRYMVLSKTNPMWIDGYSGTKGIGRTRNWDYVIDNNLSLYILVLDSSQTENVLGTNVYKTLNTEDVTKLSFDMFIAKMIIREKDFEDFISRYDVRIPPDSDSPIQIEYYNGYGDV